MVSLSFRLIFKYLLIYYILCGWKCEATAEIRYRCAPKDFIRLGNSCYYLSSEISSWQEAHFRCRDKGAQLAVLASQYEDTTLRNYLERPEFAQLGRWIGGMWANKWIWAAQGSEIENEQSFITPEVFNMDNTDQWMCLYMDPNNRYLWNSENCMRQFHYICEAPLAREIDFNSSSVPEIFADISVATNFTATDVSNDYSEENLENDAASIE